MTEIDEKLIGPPIHNVFLYNHAVGYDSENTPILATVTNGNPAVLYIFNLIDFEITLSCPLENAQGSMVLYINQEGKVVAGTFDNGGIYIVDPITNHLEISMENVNDEVFIYSLTDDEKFIYGGGFPHCSLWRISKKTKQVENIQVIDQTEKYLRSILKEGESFYLGVGTHPRLYHFNKMEEVLSEIVISEEVRKSAGSITRLSSSGNFVIGLIDKLNYVFLYDKQEEKTELFKGYNDFVLVESIIYLFNKNKIKVLSLTNKSIDLFANNFAKSYRKVVFLNLDNRKCFVSVSTTGDIIIYDIENKALIEKPMNIPGEQTIIQSLKPSPEGTLYVGGYQSGGLSIVTSTSHHIVEHKGIEQIEGMTFIDDKSYLGVYPGGHLYVFDKKNETIASEKPRYLFSIGDEQDRPFALKNNGKQVFIGTVPSSGVNGGALTIFTPESGNRKTFRNIIPNHSIISLALQEKYLFGGTSIWGGMGANPIAEDAQLFVWDIKEEKVIHTTIPVKGEKAITDLSIDYDGNLWGLTRSILFKIDLQYFEIINTFEIQPADWDVDHMWREGKILILENNTMILKVYDDVYSFFPKTGEMKKVIEKVDLIEKSGRKLYFSRGRNLYQATLY